MVRIDDELVTKQIPKLFHSEDNSQALFVQLCILCYAGLREHLVNATGLVDNATGLVDPSSQQ